ncbi:ester hydrolase C11orf54 homolog [Castor canadensis]|uniref:Ester hydrolase C11orf54 homolog n=1 Tax=Castor canadensis TaxID=51338 RepID=A0AC58KUY7_CASCN
MACTEFSFHMPSLEELAEVMQKGLKDNFADVQVSVVDCPDLTKEPFTFPVKGKQVFVSCLLCFYMLLVFNHNLFLKPVLFLSIKNPILLQLLSYILTNFFTMPAEFSSCPLTSDEQVNKWLNFYEMKAPLVCLPVFVSRDPGFDLRLEHTHFFSRHGEGGHYHYDTTPDTVEYLGYFTPAQFLYRIDQPKETHSFGRD